MDKVMELLKWLGVVIAGVVIVVKYFKYLKTKAAETSVGATKIKELEADDLIAKRDIKDLQTADVDKGKKLDKLDRDYTKIIDKVWDFIKPK